MDTLTAPLTAGIPQDETNPLSTELTRPAVEQEQQQRQEKAKWLYDSQEKLQASLLDPSKLDYDFSKASDPELAQKRALVRGYLLLENQGQPLPGGEVGFEVERRRIARDRFQGKGIDNEMEFFNAIQQEATQKKTSKELEDEMQRTVITSSTIGMAEGSSRATKFSDWLKEAKTKPGYQPGQDFRYRELWEESQSQVKENLSKFDLPLREIWSAMQKGDPSADDISTAYHLTAPEDREDFMTALGVMANSLPAETKSAFFSNLSRSTVRGMEDLTRNLTDELGDGPDPAYFTNVSTMTLEEQEKKRIQDNKDRDIKAADKAERTDRRSFASDIRDIARNDFDPIKRLSKGKFMGAIEGGVYAAPGAIASSLLMAVPGIGAGLTIATMKGAAYEDMRRRLINQGVDADTATDFADKSSGIVGAIQFIPERIGFGAITRKSPLLNKVFTKVSDKVSSRIARFAITSATVGAIETGTEVTQDLIPALWLDAASTFNEEIPGTDWNAEFQDFGYHTLETFVACLPLALFGGAGGVNQEARNQAFASADPLVRQAYGITPEDNAAIEAAKSKGPSSLNQAIETGLENKKPGSESSIDAVQEIAEATVKAKELARKAEAAGLFPTIIHNSDTNTFTLYDQLTHEEIGSANTAEDAVKLAATHTESIDMEHADRVAFYTTILQAQQSSANFQTRGAGELAKRTIIGESRLDETLTAAQAASGNPEDLARIAAQSRLKEQTEGGDGGLTDVVFGQSITDPTTLNQGMRRTVNRIQQGGTLLTVFHEETHGFWREAQAQGRLTQDEAITFLNGLDTLGRSNSTRGKQYQSLLPANFAELSPADQAVAVDEGISEWMEAEVLRSRKGKGSRNLPPGLVSKNLSALARIVGDKNVGKFRSFIRAIRDYFGIALDRAFIIQQAIAKGELKEKDYDAFINKLHGLTEQTDFEQMVIEADQQIASEIEANFDEQAFIDQEFPNGNPFSIGRANITPGPETQTFEGKEGSPSVIGPASFSIGDYRIQHQPNPEDSRLDSLEEMFGKDIYGPNAIRYYGAGQAGETEAANIFKRVKGKPDAPVTIYRVVPDFVTEINPGDWVTISKKAAEGMNDGSFLMADEKGNPQTPKILTKEVTAKEVRWPGDSMLEQGYFPGGDVAFSISAYHGTPHKVDKFSTEKIGTGEGAQAYGWGLYFADSEEVASGYRDALSSTVKVDGKTFNLNLAGKAITGNEFADLHLTAANGDKTKALSKLNERLESATPRTKGMIEEAILALEKKEIERINQGNLYNVTLNVKEDQLLDYDKPLAEQSEAVRAALIPLIEQIRSEFPEAIPAGFDINKMAGIGYLALFSRVKEDRLSDDRTASERLNSAGIKGIRYLDGDSRNSQGWKITPPSETVSGKWMVKSSDYNSKGLHFDTEADAKTALAEKIAGQTYNYVIFNEADIEILEENGQPVNLSAPSNSIGQSRIADLLRDDATSRIRNPEVRAKALSRIARNLESLRLEAEKLELQIGNKRLRKSLQREAAVRQAMRFEELENQALARHSGILSDDDLTVLTAQPLHSHLVTEYKDKAGRNRKRGLLMSRTEAAKKHPDMFTRDRAGEYDGADGMPSVIYGGTRTPDQAAQDLFDLGLISDPYADTMWEALRREQNSVQSMKTALENAKADLRAARATSQAEAKTWLESQIGNQELNFTPKEEILRASAMLDAILTALPAELRGKIGGYTPLARLGSDETRLAFLRDRLARADRLLENHLKKEFDKQFRKLLERARPEKDEVGKRPKGKIGADVHALFQDIRDAMLLNSAETEAMVASLDILAADPEITPEQSAHLTIQSNLVSLVGNWHNASADRMEAALLEGERIFARGYLEQVTKNLRKAERYRTGRAALKAATNQSGHRMERVNKAIEDAKKKSLPKQFFTSLLSFEQVLTSAFGRNSKEANQLVDWERHASSAKHDATFNAQTLIEDLFTSLAGGKYKGEQLRWDMSKNDKVTVKDGFGVEQTMSELEAISATMMWRQEDGRRHMEGHQDENGKHIGDWNWTDEAMDSIENQLSDNAKAVRMHLTERYAGEYNRLNAIYVDLYGVSLPKHKLYSPITVKPVQAMGGQSTDPVTGFAVSGNSMSPGSLKTRSSSAIAEPEFRDALQTFIAHTAQMEHWMAYAPFVTEAQALINNREVGNSIEAKGGKETLSVLRSWLDYHAQGGTRDASAQLAANKILGRMTSRAATVALVGRVSVLAIQATQILAGAAEMPMGAFIKRFAKLHMGQLNWKEAIHSDFIRRRREQMPPVVAQAMQGLINDKPSRVKFASRKMGETITGADALFTAGTYAIIYDYQIGEAKKLGLTGKEAEAYAHEAAERSTERVAQPTRQGTRSLYENLNTSPIVRIAWAFASESRQKLALAAFAFSKDRTAGERARALFVTWIAGGVVAALIRATMRDMKDDSDDELFDERNWDPKRLALSSITGPVSGVPVLGDLLEAGVYKMFGEYLPEGNLLSGTIRAGESAKKVPEWFTGERDFDDAVKDAENIISGAGIFSGNAAGAAGFAHVIRDFLNMIDNAID